ncbi:hypothetical protein H2198_006011 [Neophaeococcomyces mojaviensis]|uniref:Uncharacterized protein n=1 Tax=Neophaeococcomyces mojaviensis TaxID=3383035 RepID=A0ACC3A4A0_9EURO|nr:hypothetical protein H2198_006011 [Knufia sp. JES_112]
MNAVHLPPLLNSGDKPRFSFPSSAPEPSDLQLSCCPMPIYTARKTVPSTPSDGTRTEPTYLVKVLTTSPTRHELTWQETLLPERFTTIKGPIPCHDVVGQVVAVNGEFSESPTFSIGDCVFGLIDFDRDGAAAEYTIVKESEIAQIPARPEGWEGGQKEWEEMLATVPLSALTAWQALFRYGELQEPLIPASTSNIEETTRSISKTGPDSTLIKRSINVLITGAAGGVGLLTIQLLNIARCSQVGVRVNITAICSKRHAATVKQLGADHVLTYDANAPSNQFESMFAPDTTYDLILDLVGPSLLTKLLNLYHASCSFLNPLTGKIVSIAAPLDISTPAFPSMNAKEIQNLQSRFKFFVVKPDAGQLGKIGALIAVGQIRGFVDRVFPLEQGKEAMEECERRGRKAAGKVVIRVGLSE